MNHENIHTQVFCTNMSTCTVSKSEPSVSNSLIAFCESFHVCNYFVAVYVRMTKN